MPVDTDQIFVVDRDFNYLGSLLITTLLTEEPGANGYFFD